MNIPSVKQDPKLAILTLPTKGIEDVDVSSKKVRPTDGKSYSVVLVKVSCLMMRT